KHAIPAVPARPIVPMEGSFGPPSLKIDFHLGLEQQFIASKGSADPKPSGAGLSPGSHRIQLLPGKTKKSPVRRPRGLRRITGQKSSRATSQFQPGLMSSNWN